jgi:hypothetical protein
MWTCPKCSESLDDGFNECWKCGTFKDGADALKAGKSIRYVGAAGENNFNQWNNSQQGYNLVTMDKGGNEVTIGTLSEEQTQKIIDAGGGA